MRSFGCDHCGATVRVTELINRRPTGWATLRVDQVGEETGPRRSVTTAKSQHELYPDCLSELRNFLLTTTPEEPK